MDTSRALATPSQVAEHMGTSPATLAQQRYKGTGPKFVKVTGRRVMYRWEDVEAFLDAQTFAQTGGVR